MISICIDPKRVTEFWGHFKPLIKRAVAKGTFEFEGIEQDVINGRSLLWVAFDETLSDARTTISPSRSRAELDNMFPAAAVTKLYDGVCEITACSGAKLKTFLPLIKDLEAYARDEKCRAVRVVGRRGWIRVLRAYQPVATVLERAL